MRPGDQMTWLYVPRGGYGYVVPVDARVVKVGQVRVQIEVMHLRRGLVRRWVRLENLKRRVTE